jgi:hypothetical protein
LKKKSFHPRSNAAMLFETRSSYSLFHKLKLKFLNKLEKNLRSRLATLEKAFEEHEQNHNVNHNFE